MELPFVPRKTYDILQENCNKINDERIKIARQYKAAQEENLKLKEEIKKLKSRKKPATKTAKKPAKKEAK